MLGITLIFEHLPLHETRITPSIVLEHAADAGQYASSWNIPLHSIARQQLATMSKEELEADWKLEEFFGTIAVINLPNETQRLSKITDELRSIGTHDFLIFSAIDGRKDVQANIWEKFHEPRIYLDMTTDEGKEAFDRIRQAEAGCYMSHYLLIKSLRDAFVNALTKLQKAIKNNDPQASADAAQMVKKYSRVLILEDDNGFGYVNEEESASTKWGVGRQLRAALQELPDHWDMLYFMCAPHQNTKKFSPHLQKIRRSVFLNAYAINHTMYDSLIKTLEVIENPLVQHVKPVDKQVSNIHSYHQVFAINPAIAFQYNTISSIDGTYHDKLVQKQPFLHPSGRKIHLAP